VGSLVNNTFERTWKEAVLTEFEVLSLNSPGVSTDLLRIALVRVINLRVEISRRRQSTTTVTAIFGPSGLC
jgi:hypothetical protein